MVNLIFRDGTKVENREYAKGHFTYVEIKKGPYTEGDRIGEVDVYMRRWYILVFPRLFSIRIHHIQLGDLDRWPHDHPWSFLSIILRGGYTEWHCTPETFGSERVEFTVNQREWARFLVKHVRFFNIHNNTDLHQIREFHRPGKGSWTLIFTGPERREWGFMTDKGWVSRVALNLGASAPREPFGPEPD